MAATSSPFDTVDGEEAPVQWGRRRAKQPYQPFGDGISEFLTRAFHALLYAHGPAVVQYEDWKFDFNKQECRWTQDPPDAPRVLFKPINWPHVEPYEALPRDDNDVSIADSAEDRSALLGRKACGQWLWFPAPRQYADPEGYARHKWQAYTAEENRAIEAGYDAWVAAGCPDAGPTCVVHINHHYDAVFAKGNGNTRQRKRLNPELARQMKRVKVVWMYADGSTYKAFERESSMRLEAALVARQAMVRYTIKDKHYVADLIGSCQYGADLSRRSIRRVGPRVSQQHIAPEKFKVEGRLIRRVAVMTVPSSWMPNTLNFSSPFTTAHRLKLDSSEATEIIEYMNRDIGNHGATFRRRTLGFHVTALSRLQNSVFWSQFAQGRSEVANKWRNELPTADCSRYLSHHPLRSRCLNGTLNEYRLWCATSSQFVNAVLQGCGADVPVASVPARDHRLLNGKYGVHFTDMASYADQYLPCLDCKRGTQSTGDCCCANPNFSNCYVLLLYRVCLGFPLISLDRAPPAGAGKLGDEKYDSVLLEEGEDGGTRHFREVILHLPFRCYPEYAVYYRRGYA